MRAKWKKGSEMPRTKETAKNADTKGRYQGTGDIPGMTREAMGMPVPIFVVPQPQTDPRQFPLPTPMGQGPVNPMRSRTPQQDPLEAQLMAAIAADMVSGDPERVRRAMDAMMRMKGGQ